MTRPLWHFAGFIFLALGWIGLVMPMMPGFVFLLVACFCFARGNPAWEQRMLDHPRYGRSLRDWRERRAIAPRAKMSAIAVMAVTGVVVWNLVGHPWAWVSIGAMTCVSVWMWTRPNA